MNIKNMQLLISIQLKDYKDYQTVISFLEVVRVYPETIIVLQICVITLIPWHHNIICVPKLLQFAQEKSQLSNCSQFSSCV